MHTFSTTDFVRKRMQELVHILGQGTSTQMGQNMENLAPHAWANVQLQFPVFSSREELVDCMLDGDVLLAQQTVEIDLDNHIFSNIREELPCNTTSVYSWLTFERDSKWDTRIERWMLIIY